LAEAGVMKIQLMHRDLNFYTVFVPRIWFQVSGKIDAIAQTLLYETTFNSMSIRR
jgi:hypothetical protein